MKNLLFLSLLILTGSGCNQRKPDVPADEGSKVDSSIEEKKQEQSTGQNELFTLEDAEKILGQEAHVIDSSIEKTGGTSRQNFEYTANTKDSTTGKTGAIYVMIENYPDSGLAKKAYFNIKTANEDHEGIKAVDDLGENAYFHSDNENFYFILVQKDNKMLRMKVNKITSKTKLNEFMLVARKITSQL